MNGEHKIAEGGDSAPVNWSIGAWCPAAGISRTAEHQLPAEMKPRSIQIGRRRIIIEGPREWALRIREMQKEAA